MYYRKVTSGLFGTPSNLFHSARLKQFTSHVTKMLTSLVTGKKKKKKKKKEKKRKKKRKKKVMSAQGEIKNLFCKIDKKNNVIIFF